MYLILEMSLYLPPCVYNNWNRLTVDSSVSRQLDRGGQGLSIVLDKRRQPLDTHADMAYFSVPPDDGDFRMDQDRIMTVKMERCEEKLEVESQERDPSGDHR